mmetsp:Transcript_52503/g.78450  ORF Transcript_52503/g.78450 Transcript_52503/m.78450 type:complete len:208 (-) Transcript_52503:442-1065(-)
MGDAGVSGWIARNLMEVSNPLSTQAALKRLQPKGTFVELGGGGGAGLKSLAELGELPSEVYCVEISDDFYKTLREVKSSLPYKDRITLLNQDAKDLSSSIAPGTVDTIFGMNVVYFLDPLPEYLTELHSLLKPGGVLSWGCKFKVLPQDNDIFVNVDKDKIVQAMDDAGFIDTTATFVEGDDSPTSSFVEVKGTKRTDSSSCEEAAK